MQERTDGEPDSRSFFGLFFGKDVVYLYRGDARTPESIFANGFIARGENFDLLSHGNPIGEHWGVDSGYVATSTSKKIASSFPKELINKGFLYEINAQHNAVNVAKGLIPEVSAGRLDRETAKILKAEKEMAVPFGIKHQDIKGVWPVDIIAHGEDGFVRIVRDTFIPNEHYVPSTYVRVSKAVHGLGKGLSGVCAVMDGLYLYQAYEDSKRTGDYRSFFTEGTKIIGGWSGAITLGSAWGTAAAVRSLPLGPYVALTAGVVGGVTGSVVGYHGGSSLAEVATNTGTAWDTTGYFGDVMYLPAPIRPLQDHSMRLPQITIEKDFSVASMDVMGTYSTGPTLISEEFAMPRKKQTSINCFTKEQQRFLPLFSYYWNCQRTYGADDKRTIAARLEASRASAGRCNISFMEEYIAGIGPKDFDSNYPDHLRHILPHLVAMNGDVSLKYLSYEDYGRVIAIRKDHERIDFSSASEFGVCDLLGKMGHPELAPITEASVDYCPEYWQQHDGLDLSSRVTEGAQIRIAAHQARGRAQAEIREMFESTDRNLSRHDAHMEGRFTSLRAQVADVDRSVVGDAAKNQAYRGLMLEYTRNQMVQGMEGDKEVLACKQRFDEKCARNGIAPGSREDSEETIRFMREIGTRREVVQKHQEEAHLARQVFKTSLQLGQDIAEGFGMLARWTGNRSFAHIGKGFAAATKIASSFDKISSGVSAFQASQLASAATGSTGLATIGVGNIVGGIVGLMSVLDMLMPQEEDGLGKALGEIQEQLNFIQEMIQHMWTEMRESFQETWRMLEMMEDKNAKRFLVTKDYLESILLDISHLQSHQDRHFAHLQAQVGRMHMELAAGLNRSLDQHCTNAMEEIRQGDSAYLDANYPKVISPLLGYLLIDGVNALKTGYMPLPLDPVKMIDALRSSDNPKIGLLASIANSFQPGFVREPAGLIGGDSWVKVSEVYDNLIRYRGIHEEKERVRIIAEVNSVRSKATQVYQFLHSLSTPQTGRPLFDSLVANYAEQLEKAKTCAEQVIEQERRRINREKIGHEGMNRDAISAIEECVLLRLDETLEETNTRLTATSTALWQKSVDWAACKFKYVDSPQDIEALPDVCKLTGRTNTRYPAGNPGEISMGPERLSSLKEWRQGAHLPPETSKPERLIFAKKNQSLFMLDEYPILNLSLTYGVMKDPGGQWVFGRHSFNRWYPSCMYLVHNMQINAANIPIAVTQFAPHALAGSKDVTAITAIRASFYGPGGHTDLVAGIPCTSLITQEALLDVVKPELTTLLMTGCERAGRELAAKKSFMDALLQLELSRLIMMAFLKRLGVDLTPQQDALFVSEHRIKVLLDRMKTTKSVEVVKELLTCLDINKCPLPQAAVLPTLLPALQNAVWDLVPRDLTRLPLYQEMRQAEGKLARLEDDLRDMELRVVEPVISTELDGLREKVGLLTDKVSELQQQLADLMISKTQSDRQHQQQSADLMAMMQQLLMRMPAQPLGVPMAAGPAYDPRLFAAVVTAPPVPGAPAQAIHSV